jgi:large subunit ribosomal protein L21
MYAIVEIAGQQFKVERGNRVNVHRLEANEGDKLEFDRVLLLENGGKIAVGNPLVDGARVAATVMEHFRGDKVAVFKKKRRKGFQKWNNHRQSFTKLMIEGVLGKGEKLSETAEVKKPAKKKAADAESAAPEKTEATVKKAPAKKAPAKKTAKKKED